jgi:hypothetical protein
VAGKPTRRKRIFVGWQKIWPMKDGSCWSAAKRLGRLSTLTVSDGLATERESEIAVRGRYPKKTIKIEQLVRPTADGEAVTEPACSSELRRRWSILLTFKKLMSSQRYEK